MASNPAWRRGLQSVRPVRRVAELESLADSRDMRLMLRHPVWSGLSFEGLLIVLFMLFPAGACNWTTVGGFVVYAHYPALLFVERVLGIEFSGKQALLSASMMITVWVGLFFALRWVCDRAGLLKKEELGTANKGAAPNDGPATQLGNLGVTKGPPSVS